MGHTFSNLLVHVIFGTKGRRRAILEPFRPRLHEYLAGVARAEFGSALTIGGTEDHLHGLLLIRADVSVSEAMRKWKSLSSGWLHETFAEARDFAWQTGFAVFSVSESMKGAVTTYIAGQAEHHRRQTFEEEYLAFLDGHGIKYDRRYVWDDELGG